MSIAHPIGFSPVLSPAKKRQHQRPFQLIGELINHSFARAARPTGGNPANRTFQSHSIEVNEELIKQQSFRFWQAPMLYRRDGSVTNW